jgi:hypothetical protein
MIRFVSRRLVVAVVLLVAMAAGAILSAQRASAGMSTAATRFLAALTPEQRKQTIFTLESEERLRFNFIPEEAFPRNGLPLRAMTEEQRTLAHELLKTALSERGYMTYTGIMQLENILKVTEAGGKFARDPVQYRFSIFGEPSASGTWGWRVEGHHISLHFTIVKGALVANTPSFAGTNPAEVRDEVPGGLPKGTRVLGMQEDAGRALVTALDATQRTTAVINATAPNEILTTNMLDINPLTPAGLAVSAMTPAQRDLLMKVIDSYAGLMAADIAAERMAKIKTAGIENIAFAWAGPLERGQRHYFRVQGPTFLIEFDNSQNNGNHVHSIWRDFKGDFGRDLLREHLKTAHLGNAASGL